MFFGVELLGGPRPGPPHGQVGPRDSVGRVRPSEKGMSRRPIGVLRVHRQGHRLHAGGRGRDEVGVLQGPRIGQTGIPLADAGPDLGQGPRAGAPAADLVGVAQVGDLHHGVAALAHDDHGGVDEAGAGAGGDLDLLPEGHGGGGGDVGGEGGVLDAFDGGPGEVDRFAAGLDVGLGAGLNDLGDGPGGRSPGLVGVVDGTQTAQGLAVAAGEGDGEVAVGVRRYGGHVPGCGRYHHRRSPHDSICGRCVFHDAAVLPHGVEGVETAGRELVAVAVRQKTVAVIHVRNVGQRLGLGRNGRVA
mmetsp:Transcript_6584/g.14216  ORF Transcript_6584/g.14216 Transcript_6584/m.14216 type:complete len:302 (+) Transcript_6584:877-1782(+)